DDEQSFRYDLAIEATLYHERALEGDRAGDMEVIGQDSGDAGFIGAWHRLVHICCHFLSPRRLVSLCNHRVLGHQSRVTYRKERQERSNSFFGSLVDSTSSVVGIASSAGRP